MPVKFITDYPAAYIPEIKTLVVTDIQIGLEHELYKQGIVIQPQAEKFVGLLNKLIKLTRAKQLVILGDLKHKVPGISLRETSQLPKFFEKISLKKIILCKGNHDTDFEDLIPNYVKIYGSIGCRIKNYGFFHGHGWPSKRIMECDFLFMGHLQPGIEFQDNFGHRLIEQIWIKTEMNVEKIKIKYGLQRTGKLELTIVPAFNPLLGCAIINKLLPEDYVGPFFQNHIIDLKESHIYLLDGTHIGQLKDFK